MLLALLLACANEPAYVSKKDVEHAHAKGDTASLCAGLRMKDEDTRHEAAFRLQDYAGDTSCVCERLTRDGQWDPAVLGGLAGGEDPSKVGCAGGLLDDPAQKERAELTEALLKIPGTHERLRAAALSDSDPAVRAAALDVYRASKDAAAVGRLAEALETETDDTVRAAIARALFDQKDAEAALRKRFDEDTVPAVRAASLTSLQAIDSVDRTQLLCEALTDESADVRAQAAGALRATKDPAQIACMRERMLLPEPDGGVRTALMGSLGASPSKDAAAALCDAAPVWVRTFVKDAKPGADADILRAQNERDPDGSYDCAQAAYRAGGYSCTGKQYVAEFFQSVGGKVGVPGCGAGGGGGRSSNEVSFE